MRRWSDQINAQRKIWRDSIRTSQRQDIRDDEFHFMQGQRLENPYQQQDEEDDDDLDGSTLQSSHQSQSYQTYPDYPLGRNDSNTSLRSRSTTGDSGPPGARVAPRQFPMGAQAAQPPLHVRTNGTMSPEQGESFFSPATESPISTRSSGTPSMYGYGRQQPPPIPGWTQDDHRFTAPAMPRSQINSMQAGPRIPQSRPSLPPSAHSTNPTVNRLRSASSPDIANPVRRYDPSQVPPMPDLPQFPNTYSYQPAPGNLNRSQSSSPGQAMSAMPTRMSTQTPTGQGQRLTMTRNNTMQPTYSQDQYQMQRQYSNARDPYASPEVRMPGGTPASLMPGMSQPPPPQLQDRMQELAISNTGNPTQLKVRVHYESAGSSMVLVVPVGISFQSLKDRIDAKLQRSTTVSLATGQIKLKYADEGDLVSILSDEDVQMAFETWRESVRGIGGGAGGATVGEVELYIQ
jgi:cell division control protein 24